MKIIKKLELGGRRLHDHLYEKTIAKKTIYEGKIIDLVVEDVELPNGKTSKRELIKHPGAVCVIAVTEEKKILLIKQYRKALERVIVELPAGKLEKGEDPSACAIRELEEETGYVAEDVEHVISFYTSPGFANELVHVYYTNELKKGKIQRDEDEFLEVLEVTLDEAREMVKTGEIYDAKTAYAILYLELCQKIGGSI